MNPFSFEKIMERCLARDAAGLLMIGGDLEALLKFYIELKHRMEELEK